MKLLLLNIILLTFISSVFAQKTEKATKMLSQRGEIYVKLNLSKKTDYKYLGRQISIDKSSLLRNKSEVCAYLNKEQFEWLKKTNIDFELKTPPSMLKSADMCTDQSSVENWNCYPTYAQYIALMQSFEANYPAICKLEEFGQSIEGRKLLIVKISDNVSIKEEEPEFLYTATMHGDETAGYVLMYRLINYLLENYGTDSRITDLIDNTEIWINPLANPDGTYAAGNNTLTGATRSNSHGIDLNRNFPNLLDENGLPAEGGSFAQENIAMMDFMKAHNFVLSANIHGGAEVVNYPWDTWEAYQRVHADNDWYLEISREYADTVHANSDDYMTGFDNGVTHGATWYSITGGRQDYVNYYLHGKEVTLELSNIKIVSSSDLPDLWNYNYRSLLNYIDKVNTGVYGEVTDEDGNKLLAKMKLKGYDADSSEVYSDAITGMYYRMLLGGVYTIEATAPGYYPAEFEITTVSGTRIEQNFVLQKYPTGLHEFQPSTDQIISYTNPVASDLNIKIKLENQQNIRISLFDITGKRLKCSNFDGVEGVNKICLNVSDLQPGAYICKIHSKLMNEELRFLRLNL